MALTIYPATGWDSYISLADANALITDNVIDATSWTALTDGQKELYLRQSSLLIKLRITDPVEETAPPDLELATVLLANYSIGKDMTNNDGKSNIKRLKIEGAIEKEYFNAGSASNSFPSIVSSLLTQYDLVSSNSFKLERA